MGKFVLVSTHVLDLYKEIFEILPSGPPGTELVDRWHPLCRWKRPPPSNVIVRLKLKAVAFWH